MILLDRVESYEDGRVKAVVGVREDSPFLDNGSIPAYVALEYMAQTIAAYSGLQQIENGGQAKIGFLLGTRRLILLAEAFQLGDDLIVDAEINFNGGELAAFECTVTRNGERLAEAQLSVYQPESPEQFLAQNDGATVNVS